MKKVLLSLDEHLLRQIDRAATAAGMTRSAWIAQHAERGVERDRSARTHRSQRAVEEIRRILLEADPHPEPLDAVAAVRRARDERSRKVDRLVSREPAANPESR